MMDKIKAQVDSEIARVYTNRAVKEGRKSVAVSSRFNKAGSGQQSNHKNAEIDTARLSNGGGTLNTDLEGAFIETLEHIAD